MRTHNVDGRELALVEFDAAEMYDDKPVQEPKTIASEVLYLKHRVTQLERKTRFESRITWVLIASMLLSHSGAFLTWLAK